MSIPPAKPILLRTLKLTLLDKYMNHKYFLSFIILGLGAAISSSILIDNTFAQDEPKAGTIANVQFPVKELGNCQNEAACRTYCDKPENIKACVSFAEKNNLMSKEEIETAKKFMAVGTKGPGGCAGKESCEEYCNDISHIDECISFAEKNNLIPPQELEEAKKVQAAIKRGVKPPACGNKRQCDVYCSEADHMEECIAFGIEAGFIQGKELEDVRKMLTAIKRGVKPPPCKGKEACDVYCGNPDNMETCMKFAMEAGFMSDEEKEGAQKMLQALKKGIKPPACKSREECDIYCAEESHFEECMKFAEAAGFMSPEEAEMARKTGGKGPGGCKGKEECETFCNNPANQETCFNFAKEHGLIPEKDLRQMEEGKQRFQESLNQAPPEVISCLESLMGGEIMEKFRSGAAMPPREMGDKMRVCFEQNIKPREPGAPGEGGSIPPAGGTSRTPGPGGCVGGEECTDYCKQEGRQEECAKFLEGMQNQGSPTMPQQPMPPCEGGNCLPPPQGSQQYQPPQPGQNPMQPGQYVPPSEPAPSVEPEPSSFNINPQSLLGTVLNPFKEFLFGK